ncbi:MAG TPA: galactokinase family protein [Marmoricola sp.]|nr:galactokinase family protein [Marmoricola sp.]
MITAEASAPGRVNLIGEHLDYNGGRCLPIAIDRRTTASVRHAAIGSGSRSSQTEPTGWTAYVDGVLAALGVTEAIDVTITTTVPLGAGLSSSAALECSIALAVDGLLGLGLAPEALRDACVRAETEYVGVPTGGMDQTISLFAAPGQALLIDVADGSRTPVPLDLSTAGLTLLVIDTGVRHALVDSPYAARRSDCEEAARQLGLPLLALADLDDLRKVPGGRIGRRARHVISEQARVLEFVDAAGHADWAAAGALMTASHESLRDDYEVSCPELDVAVERALGGGALGARMTGGGFGGCAIALVPAAVTEHLGQAVEAGFADYGWDAPTLFPVEASRGAQLLTT